MPALSFSCALWSRLGWKPSSKTRSPGRGSALAGACLSFSSLRKMGLGCCGQWDVPHHLAGANCCGSQRKGMCVEVHTNQLPSKAEKPAHARARTHTHMHRDKHMCTHLYMHTQRHIHTQVLVYMLRLFLLKRIGDNSHRFPFHRKET